MWTAEKQALLDELRGIRADPGRWGRLGERQRRAVDARIRLLERDISERPSTVFPERLLMALGVNAIEAWSVTRRF